jgi:hypothetical protein
VPIGVQSGPQIIEKHKSSWLHFAAFLTRQDLEELLSVLEPGGLKDGLTEMLVPVVTVLDRLALATDDAFALPGIGEYDSSLGKISVSLLPCPWLREARLAVVEVFLFPEEVDRFALELAARGKVSAVVAALRPDLADWVNSHPVLRAMVLNTSSAGAGFDSVLIRLKHLVTNARAHHQGGGRANGIVVYNFARDFPLQNPFLARYFTVHRESVRRLLSGFDSRNGVRLWCSVRRSGKTTACFDLESTTGLSTVVQQTCDRSYQDKVAAIFYREVVDAIENDRELPDTFLENIVARCAYKGAGGRGRFVMIIDEYETLFERLDIAAEQKRLCRYTVVQPLLNQLVAFGRDNLIVFVGQRPDAHFILMDQNQLSPYVQQDHFPLFEHDPGSVSGEFGELVRRVITEQLSYDAGFLRTLYQETAGHPFLTVNLLVSLFDWLIEERRSVGEDLLDADLLEEYVTTKLTDFGLRGDKEFDFFRNAASEALGVRGRKATPWLHAVYGGLRLLGQSGDSDFSMSTSRWADGMFDSGLTEALGFSTDELLAKGEAANFFAVSQGVVRPRIRVLGRIAKASIPRFT